MNKQGCSIVVLCVVASSCGKFPGATSMSLQTAQDAPQSKDELMGLPKSNFETSLYSADTYHQLQVTVDGLPGSVSPDTDYQLECSVYWVSQEAKFTWQLAPLGDERSGNSNFDANTDETFNYTSTMSFRFTKADHGNYIVCRITLDNGVRISAPKLRINLATETSNKHSKFPDHTQQKTAAIGVTEVLHLSILTDRDRGSSVSVHKQENESVWPAANPDKDKDKENGTYPRCITIVAVFAAVLVITALAIGTVMRKGKRRACSKAGDKKYHKFNNKNATLDIENQN